MSRRQRLASTRDARELGLLLRANNFQAFVREQALAVLAEDGSRHLNSLSRGRYDFSVDGQDFSIVDHWNADDARSVRTLSGGETFLASLALALALAERLPELGAAAGGQAASLESLFIDEGFANLDSETLDVVASALEALGADGAADGRRDHARARTGRAYARSYRRPEVRIWQQYR